MGPSPLPSRRAAAMLGQRREADDLGVARSRKSQRAIRGRPGLPLVRLCANVAWQEAAIP